MTSHGFDAQFWERHWNRPNRALPPHPYLERELGALAPGTALDAGCGQGAEALWLANRGWRVTGADISATALAAAAESAALAEPSHPVTWVEADLTTWQPDVRFDLVTTAYAHPTIPQLDFIERIAHWVAPGGTLLVVGHAPGAHHPGEATATARDIVSRLDASEWMIETADEPDRAVTRPDGAAATLHDVVVRARRRG